MTKDKIAKKLLMDHNFKSIMRYGSRDNTVSIVSCPVCGNNHIDIQNLCDSDGHFYIRCPNTKIKVLGIYS